MILFFAPGGRVGNLLFQVAFLLGLQRSSERVLCTQLKGAHRRLEGLRRFYNSDSWLLINAIDYGIIIVIRHLLVRFGLVGRVWETPEGISQKKGLLPIRLVEGYFQRGWNPGEVGLRLRPPLIARAQAWLRDQGLSDKRLIFVHVRRGDYREFAVEGKSPLLPLEFYRRCLQKHFPPGTYDGILFLGDEPDWLREQFGAAACHYFPSQDAWTDLALMSFCEGGVISNSTFAWWGAYWCKKTLPVVGPRYWLGWPLGKWYPPRIQSAWILYEEVRDRA